VPTVTSTDGTTIAYERTGRGPALILVDGAMCYRAAGPMRPLAAHLIDHFTVYAYDRRGRGESTDTPPYAPEREVEDLRALIAAAGGRASLSAMSSGGALALATATADPGVAGLVLYEPPFLADIDDPDRFATYTKRLTELLDAGRKGDAVAHFMTHVGVPAPAIAGMRSQPVWGVFEAIAPTLAYDDQLLAGSVVPRERAARVTVPALVVSGSASPPALQQAAKATADAIPTAEHRTLDGQTHDVAPEALAPVIVEFLGGLD